MYLYLVMFAFTVIIMFAMENEKVSLGDRHIITFPTGNYTHNMKIKLDIVIVSLISSQNVLPF